MQLLFADAATGARSTSMVSQGRVGAIIAAKPEQRRTLLEEAAGITGLHSRPVSYTHLTLPTSDLV